MENAKTLTAIFIIIAVFMGNFLYGLWSTRLRQNLVRKSTNPLQ